MLPTVLSIEFNVVRASVRELPAANVRPCVCSVLIGVEWFIVLLMKERLIIFVVIVF